MVFYDQYTKQELLDQYSRSEICLPLALREQLEDEYRQRRLEQEERSFPEQKLSSSTTQIEQTDYSSLVNLSQKTKLQSSFFPSKRSSTHIHLAYKHIKNYLKRTV